MDFMERICGSIACDHGFQKLLTIMTIVEGRDMPLTCNYLRFLVTFNWNIF